MPPSYHTIALQTPQGAESFVRLRRLVLHDPNGAAVYGWSYRDPPDGHAAALLLLARAVSPRGATSEPVGWVGIQPRTFYLGGRRLRAALLLNLMVLEEHRTVRPALALVRHARELALESFDLAIGYPNRAAVGVFRRAGYRTLGPIRRYACVLHHGGPIEKQGAPRWLAAPAGRLVDTMVALPRRARWRRVSASLAFEWPATSGAGIDRLWLAARQASRDIVGCRDAAFLRWRYLQNPTEPHRLATLQGRDGEILGFATVLVEGSRAHLGDLFARDEHLGPLCDGLCDALYREGVSVVDVAYLGRSRLLEALQSRGFRPREDVRTAVVDLSSEVGIDHAVVADPERWQLMPGDGDL